MASGAVRDAGAQLGSMSGFLHLDSGCRSNSGSLGFGSTSFDELLTELLLPEEGHPGNDMQLCRAPVHHEQLLLAPPAAPPVAMPQRDAHLEHALQQAPAGSFTLSPDSSSQHQYSSGQHQHGDPSSRRPSVGSRASPFAVQNPMLQARLAAQQATSSAFGATGGACGVGHYDPARQHSLNAPHLLHSAATGSGALSELSVATHASYSSAPGGLQVPRLSPPGEPLLLHPEAAAAALHRRSASYSQGMPYPAPTLTRESSTAHQLHRFSADTGAGCFWWSAARLLDKSARQHWRQCTVHGTCMHSAEGSSPAPAAPPCADAVRRAVPCCDDD